MSDNPYKLIESENAFGGSHIVKGPGMPQYANEIQFIQPLNEWAIKCFKDDSTNRQLNNAHTMQVFLNIAYAEGKKARSRELMKLLSEWRDQ